MTNPSPSAPSPIPARAADAWAEVRAHDAVTRYRRSGAGRAVLVLQPADAAEPLWPELGDALAARFRLIVPEPPAAGVDAHRWLGDFLEGLGVAEVVLVAAGAFCMPSLELALRDAGQVAQVVLVPDGRSGESALDGALAAGTGGAAVPLLVVRRGLPAEAALPLVLRFLAGERAPAGG